LGSNIYHMYILNYLVTIAYCIVTLKLGRVQIVSIYFIHKTAYHFYTPSPSRRPYLMWLGMTCRRPHNNFNSVYRIFTKLDHMIALWKGKNPIYFGVIRSKVTVTINRMFYRLIIYIDGHILWCTHFLFYMLLAM
jgi:hypothetical protein